MSKSNLTIRVATSALAAPALLSLIFLAPPWAWFLAILAVTVLAGHEFICMTQPSGGVARWGVAGLCGLYSTGLYFCSADPRILVTLTLAVPILGFCLPLWRLRDIPAAALNSTGNVVAPFYMGLLVCIALVRRDMPGPTGSGFALLTLMIAWMADTGGYFAGRAFGRTKLYEKVSPKKTREGALGGLVGSVFSGLLAHFTYLPSLPLSHAIALGAAGSALGQLGDLSESLLKRSTNIKDSGTMLPGHGGLLDRVDGLLFVAPLVYAYSMWVR